LDFKFEDGDDNQNVAYISSNKLRNTCRYRIFHNTCFSNSPLIHILFQFFSPIPNKCQNTSHYFSRVLDLSQAPLLPTFLNAILVLHHLGVRIEDGEEEDVSAP